MDKKELKIKYNKLLERHFNAQKFFSDNSVSMTEKELQENNYKKLTQELSKILFEIGEYDDVEALEGFKIQEVDNGTL